jgi:hypothetical protein
MKEPQNLSGAKKPSCPWNKDIIVWEMENEIRKWEKKEKKKCCDHVRKKRQTKLVSKYYSYKLVSIFIHQNFLVKVV